MTDGPKLRCNFDGVWPVRDPVTQTVTGWEGRCECGQRFRSPYRNDAYELVGAHVIPVRSVETKELIRARRAAAHTPEVGAPQR